MCSAVTVERVTIDDKIDGMSTKNAGKNTETVTVTVRMDKDLKDRASAVIDYYGLDVASVTRAFFTAIVRTQSIPLDLGPAKDHSHYPDFPTVDWEPNEETIAAFREAEELAKDPNRKGYTSASELIAAILAEDDDEDVSGDGA